MELLDEAKCALAGHFGVPPECVLITNGVDDAIDSALLHTQKACSVSPGFDAYLERSRVLSREHEIIRLDDAGQPVSSSDTLNSGQVFFLAQPNNPTGTLVDHCWIDGAIEKAGLVFLDETYIDFCEAESQLHKATTTANLVVFRSFSKAYGLAGLRLGAVVSAPHNIVSFKSTQRFAPISTPSLHALIAALADEGHVAGVVAYVRAQVEAYAGVLTRSGLFAEVRTGHGNFVTCRLFGQHEASTITSLLEGEGVLVKDCASLGMPTWLRVSVGHAESLPILSDALAAVAARSLVSSAD